VSCFLWKLSLKAFPVINPEKSTSIRQDFNPQEAILLNAETHGGIKP
jgi:hypothetical protein